MILGANGETAFSNVRWPSQGTWILQITQTSVSFGIALSHQPFASF